MILHGNQRGGAKDLALHLLKEDNEHVEVHELRGFASDNLVSALNEAYAVSKGTKAKQFLFSLSLNPPPEENVSTQDFLEAIARVENKLGLAGQPRAIVFHEKNGRRHAHAVWSRTDTRAMKAIQLSHTKAKLMDVSRELYLQHNWKMPRGFMRSEERDLRNFSMAQWQQAQRIGKDPRHIKAALQECWAASDTQATFQRALKERGYMLARGDRRGFVVLDHRCEVFSVSKKWIGKTAKEVRARLTAPESLPSVETARADIASTVHNRLSALQEQRESALQIRLSEIEDKRTAIVKSQKAERRKLQQDQQHRQESEICARQARFNSGLRGLLDHFTGKRRRIRQQNEREALLAYQRDRDERDALIFNHLEQRRALQARIERLQSFKQQTSYAVSLEMQQYQQIRRGEREAADFRPHQPRRKKQGFEPEM